jgi:dTDP-4-dehydrorhamnose reductase
MRILLTGRGGQVGRALTTTLSSLGAVIATDRSSLDLAFPDQIRARVIAMRPDLIVNAAAYTDVERAEVEEEAAVAINGVSVGEMAVAACELQVPLIHYSTDYVFDGTKTSPYAEDDQTAPLSAYGRSKLDGEQRIRSSGCAHLILRTSWVYAAMGRNFLTTMLKLGAEREELRVVDDQFGAPTFAGFIATATAQILEQTFSSEAVRERVINGDTVHLVNAGVTSWFGFASEVFARSSIQQRMRAPKLVPIKTSEFPTRARRPANSRLSTKKARTVWNLRVPEWRESLAECLSQLR